jgi:1-deoxy-D-xylulose-5-phosphate synthase
MALAKEVSELLASKSINATIVNPVNYSMIDKDMLHQLKENHDLVVTLEDGLLDGGFGEKVDRYYATSDMKVLNYGAEKNYNDLVPLAEVYKMNRLNAEQIVEDILNNIRK